MAYEKLSAERVSESSDLIRGRVQAARERQRAGFIKPDLDPGASSRKSKPSGLDIVCNADMRVAELRQFCVLDDQSQGLMRSAMTQMQLSARAYHRILKLARTIADLAACENIQPLHLAEALQYRPKLLLT